MTSFDQVIPTLLRVCHTHSSLGSLDRIAVVRDLKGRVRLAVRPKVGTTPDVRNGLQVELEEALGTYFADPILSAGGQPDEARLARSVIAQCSTWPSEWDSRWTDAVTGLTQPIDAALWGGMQRMLSKESWLCTGGAMETPPWSLEEPKTPGIVSFYSFKGGVGRSTLLAATASQLASRGHHVAVVDLDLEAPGLASLFGVTTARGVLHFVVDQLAAESGDLSDCFAPVPSQPLINVFPAGSVALSFIEKLGRLDYAGNAL